MSISRIPTEFELEIKRSDKVKGAAKKAFKSPVRTLLYVGLAGVFIGLFFGVSFAWQLYAIIACLGIANIFLHYERPAQIVDRAIKDSVKESKKP